MGERGDPISTPLICSYNSPLKLKKVEWRHTFSNLVVLEFVTSLITFTTSFNGIFMNNETTSKLMSMPSCYNFSSLMSFKNSHESFMNEFVFPTKGPKSFSTYFANS
jgi:hypothetical protein